MLAAADKIGMFELDYITACWTKNHTVIHSAGSLRKINGLGSIGEYARLLEVSKQIEIGYYRK